MDKKKLMIAAFIAASVVMNTGSIVYGEEANPATVDAAAVVSDTEAQALPAEKELTVDLGDEYKSCTFKIQMEEPGSYVIVVIGPDGKQYTAGALDESNFTCDVDRVKAGTWTIRVSDNTKSEIGKCSVSVSGKKESSTSVVDDDIRIGKDIVGLNMYFRDRTLVVTWTDDSCGNVHGRVTNLDNSNILFDETVSEQEFEVDIPESVTNITVSVVPATSLNIEDAEQIFNFKVNSVPNGNVSFDSLKITNQDTIGADVSIADSYGYYVEDNGVKVLEEDLHDAGEYEVEIPLADEGDNAIVFYLVDESGNMYSFSKDVIRDVVAPSLKLDEDYDGRSTYDDSITVSGEVSDYQTLMINEDNVNVATDGKFSYTISLHLGENDLVLSAKDEAGNETAYQLHVTMLEQEKSKFPPLSQILPLIGVCGGLALFVILSIRKKKLAKREEESDDEKTGKDDKKSNKVKEVPKKSKEPKEKPKKETKKEKPDSKKKAMPGNTKKKMVIKKKTLIAYIVYVGACVYVFFFMLGFCKVGSGSMEPTLTTGNVFVTNRLAYVARAPKRGDIVSFKYRDPETGRKIDYAKRVIGLPGDVIEFHDGYVYLNGEILDESAYLDEDVETNSPKTFMVPENTVFLLGDNREYSDDARYWDNPYVSVKEITGKMLFKLGL